MIDSPRHSLRSLVLATTLFAMACPPDDPIPQSFTIVAQGLDEALLSIAGTSATDVWAVGADKGHGPIVLRYQGSTWRRLETGDTGHLWWVQPFADGSAFLGGANGRILRYANGVFERMDTPGLGKHTVFGIWGSAPNNVYAVGGAANRSGFIWHYDGTNWEELALPTNIPLLSFAGHDGDVPRDIPGLFKVWGDGHGIVYVVGAASTILRSQDGGPFTVVSHDVAEPTTLFTVAGNGSDVAVVGGSSNGVLIAGHDGSFHAATPTGAPLLQGVSLHPDGSAWASGQRGAMYQRVGGVWTEADTNVNLSVQSLHATWIDPTGGVWAVGGNVLSTDLNAGAILHRGAPVAPYTAAGGSDAGVDSMVVPDGGPDSGMMQERCPDGEIDPEPQGSIARRWNEQQLNAIRRTVPAPGVHARNLYHVSAAMWDAWSAFDTSSRGVFYTTKHTATNIEQARREAISYAAYRVLSVRYNAPLAVRGPISLDCFHRFMDVLGYDAADTVSTGDSPRAIGNRIGIAVLAATREDGANEAGAYGDTTGYMPQNPPLVIDVPGGVVPFPSVWQQLNLSESATQNGIILPTGLQPYIGPNWRDVTPFAATSTPALLLMAQGAVAPTFESPADPERTNPLARDWVTQVIRAQADLHVDVNATIDISPGAYGNNSLGTNDNRGHAVNPAVSAPYAPNVVPRGDFFRVLAEFWADGPKSETPPGHWNTLANAVADHPMHRRCMGGTPTFETCRMGTSPQLDALEWDVKTYLALNGAVHDAAIAAWGIKRVYLASRPVTMIRHMAARGQSSDPSGPSYHEQGLPLVAGLIEVISTESSAPGERHARLAPFVGEIAVLGWRGEPGDRANDFGGIEWIRGRDWVPYQRRNFVTPAFPGFISGHSTFSRAAAEVLADLNGSEFFPGGLGTFTARRNEYLVFEDGPSTDVRLEWATYFDAADQAGQSRIWGGIHIEPDDFVGRRIGSVVGRTAVAGARAHFVP